MIMRRICSVDHESEQAHTLKHMADKIIRYDCDLSSILMLYSNDINSGCK